MYQKIFSCIISGAQTGADQGGLDAALALGIKCGGWCPKGRRSEAGKIPAKYPVQEHAAWQYPPRTRQNVVDSDGTLIFSYGPPTSGTALTVKLCKQERKPMLLIDLTKSCNALEIAKWGVEHNIQTLNVAGSRESKYPGIQKMVAKLLKDAILYLSKEGKPAHVCVNTYAGRREYACRVVGETREKFEIEVDEPTPLPPRSEKLKPGQTKLVPKISIRFSM